MRHTREIRAARRQKQAMRWAGNEKAHRGALHDGLVEQEETSVLSKPFPETRQGLGDKAPTC